MMIRNREAIQRAVATLQRLRNEHKRILAECRRDKTNPVIMAIIKEGYAETVASLEKAILNADESEKGRGS